MVRRYKMIDILRDRVDVSKVTDNGGTVRMGSETL